MTKNTFLLLTIASTLLTMGAGCSNNNTANQAESVTQTSTTEVFVSGDWKTYQDKKYGYTFDYPQSWDLLGNNTIDPAAYGVAVQGSNQDKIQIVKVTYGTNADGSVTNRESYLKMLANGGSSKTTIGGGVGYYSVNETKGGPQPMIYLVGSKEIFLMSFNIYDITKTPLVNAEKLFKQIIGSFAFTGTAASETTSLKTFAVKIGA